MSEGCRGIHPVIFLPTGVSPFLVINRTDSDVTVSYVSLVPITVRPNLSGHIKLGILANKTINAVSWKQQEPQLLLLCSFPRSARPYFSTNPYADAESDLSASNICRFPSDPMALHLLMAE